MVQKKIRVGLVTSVVDGRRGLGTALVARRLFDQLDRFEDEFEFTLIHYEKDGDPIYKKYSELLMPSVHIPFGKQFFRESVFWIKQRFKGNRFDIVHYPYPRVWPSYFLTSTRKIIITPYEAGVMLNLYPPSMGDRVFRFTNRYLHQRMHALIVCAEFAKREVAEYFHVPHDRIHIVPLGIDTNFKPVAITDENTKRLESEYGITKPYILSVARFDPHKNILRLIEAYALFRKKGCAQKLVLVGGRHMKDYSQMVDEKIRDLGLTQYVHIAPFVSDGDMPLLYSAAEAFVFPSLHEGWGMPIVEALACGTPTAASNTTACPEAAGDAAILFDPNNAEDMADAMEKLVRDPKLRDELRERGLKRAREFTWERMANVTFDLYRKLQA